MKPLIEFPLEGDESILVEVEELPTSEIDGGLVANYPGQQVVVQARTSFADAMDKIKPVALLENQRLEKDASISSLL